jgi:hypothetical protein
VDLACQLTAWGEQYVSASVTGILTATGLCLWPRLAALAVIFIWRFIPETKGRPLEQIDRY